MPYLKHFGLRQHPFALTPNAGLYFPSEPHQEVLAALIYAVRRGEGIVKVTGEIGTGKTLLCRLLIGYFIDAMDVAYINNPQDDVGWTFRAICREFELDTRGDDPVQALHDHLLALHRQGRRAVVVIDEAQALGAAGLEAVRRLSNLETADAKLLQIVLFGQPELDRLLTMPDLRQVQQRIAFSFEVHPLDLDSAEIYIRHRLEQTGEIRAAAARLFDGDALTLVARASGGVPRLINILADKSLLAAFAEGARRVSRDHVRQAVEDSGRKPPQGLVPRRAGDRGGRWRWWGAGVGAAALLLAGAVALWGGGSWDGARGQLAGLLHGLASAIDPTAEAEAEADGD